MERTNTERRHVYWDDIMQGCVQAAHPAHDLDMGMHSTIAQLDEMNGTTEEAEAEEARIFQQLLVGTASF
jgi:hypothetical protein